MFVPGEDRNRDDNEILQGIENPAYAERFGAQYEHARHDIELVREAAGQGATYVQTPEMTGALVRGDGRLASEDVHHGIRRELLKEGQGF